MARFEGRKDPFLSGCRVIGVKGFAVGDVLVTDAAHVLPVAMLRSNPRVIQPCGDRVNSQGLAIIVLEDIAEAAMQDTRTPLRQAGGMLARPETPASGLGSDQLDLGVRDERGEDPGGIQTTADTRHDRIGQPSDLGEIWSRASRPITDWKSRTIIGNGCGPTTLPIV